MQQQAVQQDVDTYLRAGKAAAVQGKIDQALTILTAATAKFPAESRAWFAVASLHAKLGHHDMAALCFQRASSSTRNQAIAEVAHDNALLESARVLPRDWLPATTAPTSWGPWSQALSLFAHDLTQKPDGVAVVLGGLGVEAVQLAVHCARQEHQQAGWHIVSCHGDQLTGTLGHLLAVSNSVEDYVSLVPDLATWLKEWQEEQAEQEQYEQQQQQQALQGAQQRAQQQLQQGEEQQEAQQMQKQGQTEQSNMLAAQPQVRLVVLPEVCSAQLSLTKAVKQLRQVANLVASGTRVCPCRIRVRGVLVDSEELLDMNRVRLDWMMQDTGLDYAPCNELLWRRVRSLQVDKLQYRCLSAPFDVLDADLQSSLTQLQSGSDHAHRMHPGRFVQLHCTASGSVTCVVTWTEVELAPGIWIRHVPQHVSADSSCVPTQPPVLQPHAWQRVYFMAEPLQVTAGTPLQLDVRLQGDELHIELDADILQVTAAAEPQHGLGSGAAAAQQTHGGEAGAQAAESSDRLQADVSDNSLPAGEPLEGDDCSSGSESEEEEKEGEEAARAASLILPYHMCMLNDRARTRHYRDGIQGAVREILHGHAAQRPPLVLDVGAGTGLLSLLAAQAGAPAVIGVEREAPLAVTASTLAHANSLQQRVHCLNMQCNALTVAADSRHAGSGDAPLAKHPTDGGTHDVADQRKCENRDKDATQRCSEGTAGHEKSEKRNDEHGVAAVGAAAFVTRDAQTGAVQLTQAPALVVHEVFGSDPLSEQILTTMRYIKAHLANSSTRFMPAGFKVVAALAWTGVMKQALCTAQYQPCQETCKSSDTAGAEQTHLPEAMQQGQPKMQQGQPIMHQGQPNSKQQTHLPEAMQQGQPHRTEGGTDIQLPDLTVLQPWVSQRVECDLAAVPDMVLLTHPKAVLHWDLNAPESPPLQSETTVCLAACPATPISHYISQQAVLSNAGSVHDGHTNDQCDHQSDHTKKPTGMGACASGEKGHVNAALEVDRPIRPNCAVYWFEADCGDGGWLSTGPGHTYYGHWSQCIDFSAVTSLPDHTTDYVVKASYMVDRVKIRVLDRAV